MAGYKELEKIYSNLKERGVDFEDLTDNKGENLKTVRFFIFAVIYNLLKQSLTKNDKYFVVPSIYYRSVEVNRLHLFCGQPAQSG